MPTSMPARVHAKTDGRTVPGPCHPQDEHMHTQMHPYMSQYTAHAIRKMNANFGFGRLRVGEGRSPAPLDDIEQYLARLGRAVAQALQRDFTTAELNLGVRYLLTYVPTYLLTYLLTHLLTYFTTAELNLRVRYLPAPWLNLSRPVST